VTDLAAEDGVRAGELEADDAAADDHDLAGDLGERDRVVARPDALHVVVDRRQLEGLGTGGEDHSIALDDLRAAFLEVDDELVGAHEPTLAVDHLDLEPPGRSLDLADQLVDDAFLARAEAVDVDSRRCRVQTELGRILRVLDDVC